MVVVPVSPADVSSNVTSPNVSDGVMACRFVVHVVLTAEVMHMPDVITDFGDFTAPPSGSPTATARDVLNEAWNHLYSNVRVERDKLDGAVTSDATSLDTTYQRGGIRAGAKLSIDLEDFHVWDVSGATVTVQPGEFGSTSAAHADASIILVNAEWTPAEVFRQMNNELKALSTALMAERTVTLTYSAAQFGYDLTGVEDVDGIVRVLAVTPGSDQDRVPVTDWRVERNLDAATFPSGFGLFTGQGFPGRDLLVTYRGQFGELASLDDDVETTTGLPYSCFDILAMGAAIRCAAPAEIDRNQTGSQGSGRRSSEVPAGARLNAIRGLVSLRLQRIVEERDRIRRRYPVRLPRR
jgi:hypothetical protein